jgi:hypothetical protein
VVDRSRGELAFVPWLEWPERALPPWPSCSHGAPPSSHELRLSRDVARIVARSGSIGDTPWPPN